MKTEERLYNKIEELERKYIATGEHIEKLKKCIKTTEEAYDHGKWLLKNMEDAAPYMRNIIDIYTWTGRKYGGYGEKIYATQRTEYSRIKTFLLEDGYIGESGYTILEIESIVEKDGGHYEKAKELKEITDAIADCSNKIEQYRKDVEKLGYEIEELNVALSNEEAEYPKIFEEGSKTLKELEENYPEYYKTKYRN